MEIKSIFRDEIKKRCWEENSQYLIENSVKICEKFLEMEFIKKSNVFLVYSSFKDEVDTYMIIDALLKQNKIVLLPNIVDNNITPVRIVSHSDISPHHSLDRYYGPIDIAVIPGRAFDMYKNRLGRGGWCYDRFLWFSDIFKIWLAFEFQILKTIPTESHDIIMDCVITEKQLL